MLLLGTFGTNFREILNLNTKICDKENASKSVEKKLQNVIHFVQVQFC